MEESVVLRLMQCLDKSCRTVISLRQEIERKDRDLEEFVQGVLSSLTEIRAKAAEREVQLQVCQTQLSTLRLQNKHLQAELHTLRPTMKGD